VIKPLVSVIIPVFNSKDFLNESLKSVWQQKYRPIELIVINDGSTDNSVEISNQFKSKYNSENFIIRQVKNKRNGAPSARNYGLSLSNGKYIQFLDSDDLLLPDKIESGINILSSTDADIVYSKAQHVERDGTLMEQYWGRAMQNNSSDCFEFPWQTMCALYTKDIINRIGNWNEELIINQDWEFALKFVINGCQIHFINEVQSYYRTGIKDNIGSGLSMGKIYSKEISTRNIYLLIKKKNKIDSHLKNKFAKRFIFVIIEYGKLEEWARIKDVSTFLKNEGLSTVISNILAWVRIKSFFYGISNMYKLIS